MTLPTCCKCNSQFLTNENLLTHLSFAHRDVGGYNCYGCARSFGLIHSLRNHLRKQHSNFNNINVSNVEPQHPNFNINVNNVEPQHPNFNNINVNNIEPNHIENQFNIQQPEDFQELEQPETFNSFNYSLEESETKAPCFEDLIKEDLYKFSAKFYSLNDVTRKHSWEIMSSLTSFLNGNAFCNLENNVIHKLQQLGETPQNIDIFKKQFDSLRNPFDCINLNSEHLLKMSFVKNGTLILPLQVTVGERKEFKKITSNAPPVLVNVKVSIEFIPLRFVFKKFFEMPNIFEQTMQYIEFLNSCKVIISNFIQAKFWQNLKSNFDSNKTILPLFLYFDDYETNNPLGSHAGLGKCGAVYVSIPCLPPAYQSKVENIFLFLLFNSLDRTQHGNRAIFQEAINELKFLAEEGITINVNGKNYVIYFHLALILGDNLGLHSLLGFTESFSANYFCRICCMHKSHLCETYHENQCILRDRNNYDENIKMNNPSLTGINSNCIFHDLSFHVTENITVDPMHDLLEGVVKYDLGLLLSYFIKKKYFTLNLLNSRIMAFDYNDNDKNSKPPEILESHINQKFLHMSASETFCFLRIITLLIGDKVPEDDQFWNLLISLKSLTEIIFSKKFYKKSHLILQLMIFEYLELLNQLFPKSLKPKHHFLIHYARIQELMGPLSKLSSMRFESKHQFGKRVSKISLNRVNVCHSIALKEQYSLNFRFIKEKDNNQTDFDFKFGSMLSKINYDEFELNNVINIQTENKIIETNWVKVGGEKIITDQKHCTILVAPKDDNNFQFVLACKIYINKDFRIIITGKLLKCDFEYHLQAFKVITTEDTPFFIEFNDIENYFITYQVQLNGQFYIVKKWPH